MAKEGEESRMTMRSYIFGLEMSRHPWTEIRKRGRRGSPAERISPALDVLTLKCPWAVQVNKMHFSSSSHSTASVMMSQWQQKEGPEDALDVTV